MTKHLTLLLFIGLGFWSCEEKVETDYLDIAWWRENAAGSEFWLLKTIGVQDTTYGTICNFIHYYDETQVLVWQPLNTGIVDTIDYCCNISFDSSDVYIEYEEK